MNKTKLGKSQYFVSKVGLGTVQFGLDYGFSKKKTQFEVDSILDCASHNGINFIDTAREYGDSERKIGDYISRHNDEFIIATKLKKMSESEVNGTILKDKILASIDESLKELRLQNLNVLQLHQTDDYLVNKEILWDTINDLKNEGILGAFGVSVYDTKETLELVENYGDVIDFFQVPYSIFDTRFEKLQDILVKYSISLVSRSTFLKGIIPCEISELPLELEGLKSYKERLEKKALHLKMSVSELALLYVYCSKNIGSILLGVNSPNELDYNIDVIEKYGCQVLQKEEFLDILVEDGFLIDPRKWESF
ncbi:MAG: aldo/keto reductase [Eubacteriales bacterium]